MIDLIRTTEIAFIPQSDEYSNSEKDFIKARRSIVAKTNIKKGEILTKDNITTKRPFLENCIPAIEFENILGKIAEKDYINDDFI